MLFVAGAVNRLGRVDDGTATTDFDEEEIERKISLQTALAHLEWKGTKINLIDTPGLRRVRRRRQGRRWPSPTPRCSLVEGVAGRPGDHRARVQATAQEYQLSAASS